MIEGAMIWNEANNKSHWDPELDPEREIYARTLIDAGPAIDSVVRQRYSGPSSDSPVAEVTIFTLEAALRGVFSARA